MLTILFIVFTMFLIYLGFCVQMGEFSLLGKFKLHIYNLLEIVMNVLPSPIKNFLKICWNHFFNKPNPIIQILYLILFIGLFLVYIFYGAFEHFPNDYIDEYYLYFGYFQAAICQYIFFKACTVSPGIINKKNLANLEKKYPFDEVYYKREDCKKCGFLKIARAKHCHICNMCIERFDHHCIWINQCVGGRNYKYFLTFIFLHSLLCIYAGILGFSILYTYVLKNRLFKTKFYNKITNEEIETSTLVIFRFVIAKNYVFFSSCVLLLTIGITLFVFVLYHLNLVSLNLTSNEKIKRDKMVKYMILIKQTMNNLFMSNEYSDADKEEKINFFEEYNKLFKQISVSKEDEIRFDEIVFKNETYDLKNLKKGEIFKFAKYSDERLIKYKNNFYYVGFWKCFEKIFSY